ncbi:MAG: SH3 domain-containing protein [Pseudomonadota bacterium]
MKPALSITAFCLLAWVLAWPAGLAAQEQAATTPEGEAAEAEPRRGPSGLLLPRFVSLRSDEVNLRTGPGVRYPIDWVFQREGLPLEVIDEFENWRRVRDRTGTEGWVHRAMLSGNRTIVIEGERRSLLADPTESAATIAYLEPGFLAGLERCLDAWCSAVAVGPDGTRYRGWLLRDGLWGLYPDEIVE